MIDLHVDIAKLSTGQLQSYALWGNITLKGGVFLFVLLTTFWPIVLVPGTAYPTRRNGKNEELIACVDSHGGALGRLSRAMINGDAQIYHFLIKWTNALMYRSCTLLLSTPVSIKKI